MEVGKTKAKKEKKNEEEEERKKVNIEMRFLTNEVIDEEDEDECEDDQKDDEGENEKNSTGKVPNRANIKEIIVFAFLQFVKMKTTLFQAKS